MPKCWAIYRNKSNGEEKLIEVDLTEDGRYPEKVEEGSFLYGNPSKDVMQVLYDRRHPKK